MRTTFQGVIVLGLITLCTAAFTQAGQTRQDDLRDRFIAGPFDLATADYVAVTSDRPPPPDANWQPVALPHLWSASETTAPGVVWYRFRLADAGFSYQAAVYFWRFSMNIAVWLNDDYLGDGGRFTEPVARNWNRPFLFLLPDSAFREKDNYLYVKLAIYPGWGNLPPIVVGPAAQLRKDYDARFWWQISTSQATFYISLITALVAFTFWYSDRRSTLYAIFGFTCLAWSVFSLNLYIQEIPVSAKTWWALVHSSVDWYGVTLALFAHRLIGIDAVRRDRMLLGFGIAATLFYFAVDLPTLSRYNNIGHAATLLIAAYVALLSSWVSLRTRRADVGALAFCMWVIFGFGAHDFGLNTMLSAELWHSQYFWLQFSAPILMLTMLVMLARRFIQAMQARVNAELQIRTERERIFSDIHDDVGSRVLSLVYSAENESQADLAREALREIRAIVAGGSATGGKLPELLETFQAEAQQRFDAADITLLWNVTESGTYEASDKFQYHLQRILRELISNTIKHAGSERVEIVVQADHRNVTLNVRDFGNAGFLHHEHFTPGNGMSGVKRRTMELGGEVTWEDAAPGCRVSLVLPYKGNPD